MIQLIKKGARLSEENKTLLWSELVLFSILSGLVCHSLLALLIVFWMSLKVHINGLKWHWDEMVYKTDDTIECRRFSWSGPNANRHGF